MLFFEKLLDKEKSLESSSKTELKLKLKKYILELYQKGVPKEQIRDMTKN